MDKAISYSKVIGTLLRNLSLVPSRYSETPQFGDCRTSVDIVTSEKSAWPSALHQPAWMSELNLKPTIIFKHEKHRVLCSIDLLTKISSNFYYPV